MNSIVRFTRAVLLLGMLCFGGSASYATVLYDGSGGLTLEQYGGWSYNEDGGSLGSLATSPSHFASGGGTNLQTMDPLTDRAGFQRTDLTLNRTLGYTLRFNLRIDQEAIPSNDRAGFSLTALSPDLTGIELAFWGDRVFAQAGAPSYFTHAEELLVDNTSAREYLLTVQGSSYSLSWTGGGSPLTGSLRNYTGYGSLYYFIPNLLALSDNTTQASANVWIGNIEFQTIPEPSTLLILLVLGFVAGVVWRVRKLQNKPTMQPEGPATAPAEASGTDNPYVAPQAKL